MPHIQLETTSNLPENERIGEVLRALAEEFSRYETVLPESVKVHHHLCESWAMGEGAPEGFAHCEISVLGGRSDDLRVRMADGMASKMRELFAESILADRVAVSLELREMNPKTYRK